MSLARLLEVLLVTFLLQTVISNNWSPQKTIFGIVFSLIDLGITEKT